MQTFTCNPFLLLTGYLGSGEPPFIRASGESIRTNVWLNSNKYSFIEFLL